MTPLLNIIQIVALMGAVSILAFDKRKSRHCRSASLLAYIMFVLFGSLFMAATAKSWPFVQCLMTAIMTIQVVNLILARGNVKDISATIPPRNSCPPKPRRRPYKTIKMNKRRKENHV